jgi:hypothetical protein
MATPRSTAKSPSLGKLAQARKGAPPFKGAKPALPAVGAKKSRLPLTAPPPGENEPIRLTGGGGAVRRPKAKAKPKAGYGY